MVAAILHLDKGARALREAGDEMRGGRLDRHDIGNPGFSFICETGRVELFPVAEHPAHLRHSGERLGLDLSRAAGDEYPRFGPGALGPADRLPRLAHRFVGDGTAVDDDEVVLVRREVPHCHALGGIQAAAQGDHLGAAHPRVSRSISPVKTCVAGPDMRMRPPGSQSTVSEPPGSRTSTGRWRSEEHTSELQSLMRNSYAVFCLK